MHDTIKAFYYLMTYPPPKLCQNTYQHNIMSMSVNDKSFGLYYLSIYLVIFYDLLDEYTFTQVHVCTPTANGWVSLESQGKQTGGCEQEVIWAGLSQSTIHKPWTCTQNMMNRGPMNAVLLCVAGKSGLWFAVMRNTTGSLSHGSGMKRVAQGCV